MKEQTSCLEKINTIYQETTPEKPPIIVHSCTPGAFPDGTPLTATRYRKGFFCYVRDLMAKAIRKGEVKETSKIKIANEVHQYLTHDICIRPPTLIEQMLDGATNENIEIKESDVNYITTRIIDFLSGTSFEIIDRRKK